MKKLLLLSIYVVFALFIVSCGGNSKPAQEEYPVDSIEWVIDEPKKGPDYQSLGSIPCYYYDAEEEKYEICEEAVLYVVVINDKEYYYVGIDEDEYDEKFPIERCSIEINGHDCNGRVNIDSIDLYMHIQAWGGRNMDSEEKNNSNNSNGTQTIVVEHQRSLQPMQVWIPCGGCGGSGQCNTCLGTGTSMSGESLCISCHGNGKCHFCAGQGGHNEVQYR